MNKLETKILDYIDKTHARYELSKIDPKHYKPYIFVSKKLHRLIGKASSVSVFMVDKSTRPLTVIVSKELSDASFYFGKTEKEPVPEIVYDVVLTPLIYEAIRVDRVTAPLDNDVSYKLKLGAKLSMEELAFMLAIIVEEMDKSGNCAKEDMLKLINKHLSK